MLEALQLATWAKLKHLHSGKPSSPKQPATIPQSGLKSTQSDPKFMGYYTQKCPKINKKRPPVMGYWLSRIEVLELNSADHSAQAQRKELLGQRFSF